MSDDIVDLCGNLMSMLDNNSSVKSTDFKTHLEISTGNSSHQMNTKHDKCILCALKKILFVKTKYFL